MSTDHDDQSSPATPVVSSGPEVTVPPPTASSPHLILPIPTPSLNKSQSSVVFSHTVVTSEDGWSSLPPEVATADISIACEYALGP